MVGAPRSRRSGQRPRRSVDIWLRRPEALSAHSTAIRPGPNSSRLGRRARHGTPARSLRAC